MSVDGISPTGCGCIGCTNDRVAIIDHPDHGRRVVCRTHINGYPVRERVGAGRVDAGGSE